MKGDQGSKKKGGGEDRGVEERGKAKDALSVPASPFLGFIYLISLSTPVGRTRNFFRVKLVVTD